MVNNQDSGSGSGDVVYSRKRPRQTRRTNKSSACDPYDDDSEIPTLPPPKRLHIYPNGKEALVLIGVWKDSPPSDPARKHAVYAFIDSGNCIRQKVYPETRDGDLFQEGYPSGARRAFVSSEFVILDTRLSSLDRQELKEYIRIRMSHREDESPEERKKAEALAIEEAKKVTSKDAATPNTSIPNGVFLGFWKDSDAAQDVDKHAAFGVVDSNRLRVKVIKFTRDSRPYQGNFPTNPGGNWIPFDDVVREPALAKMLRLEVIEYVKIRQSKKLQESSDYDPFRVDADAIDRAIKTFAVTADAQGLSAAKLDAQNESSRKAHNESRAALRANPVAAKGWKYESPYAKTTSDNSRYQDAKDKGSPSVATSSKNDQPTHGSNPSKLITGTSFRSNKAEADATAEKLRRVSEAAAAKAKENGKGGESAKVAGNKEVRLEIDRKEQSDGLKGRTARIGQERLEQVKEMDQEMAERNDEQANGNSDLRNREATGQDDVAKQGDSMTPRQRAIKEVEARKKEIRAKEAKDKEEMEREAAEARAEMAKARAEMEKAKADVIKSVSDKLFNITNSSNTRPEGSNTVEPSPDHVNFMNRSQPSANVKIHNDVKYVQQKRGPFAGKLVGEKREFLTIDGENYVECRILVRMEF